jgi:hypothetical protein
MNQGFCGDDGGLRFGLLAGDAAAVGEKLTISAEHFRLATQGEFGDLHELAEGGLRIFGGVRGKRLQRAHVGLVHGHLLDHRPLKGISRFQVLFEGFLQFDLVLQVKVVHPGVKLRTGGAKIGWRGSRVSPQAIDGVGENFIFKGQTGELGKTEVGRIGMEVSLGWVSLYDGYPFTMGTNGA